MTVNDSPISLLLNKTQMSVTKLAKATGINEHTLRTYLNGRHPSSENLIILADYFAVPTDFLLGRCSEDAVERIVSNYSECFMTLRQAPYIAYLSGRPPLNELKSLLDENEAPYPYNLVNAINKEPIQHVMYEGNLKPLENAIGMLSERDRDILLAYYKNGLTLREIGERYSVSSERVRQILLEIIHRLSHPSIKDAIVKGYDTVEKLNEESERLTLKEQRLRIKERDLNIQKEHLEKVRAQVRFIIGDYSRIVNIIDQMDIDDNIEETDVLNMPIEKMDLSRRAYSCLKNSNCNTVRDIKEILDRHPSTLLQIRQLGEISAQQVVDSVNTLLHTQYKINDSIGLQHGGAL